MKIVVLGASGGIGKQVVKQAINRGDSVVAVGRESSDIDDSGADVRRGDLTDQDFLADCFTGADVVISGLGPRMGGLAPWNKPQPRGFVEASARAIVDAAKEAGVSRVMAVSAGGVGESLALMPGFFKLLIKSTSLRHAYPELNAMEQVLLGSGLDVVIARPTGLTDGPVTDAVVEVTALKGQASISRADVAAFLLGKCEGSVETKAPIITVTGAA